MNIVEKIKNILRLYLKKKKLEEKRSIYSQTSISEKLSKTFIADGANITLNSKTKELVNKVNQEIESIINNCQCSSDKILEYIKKSNISVYFIPQANNILKYIGEEEGFIPEKTGVEALVLSIITMNGLKFCTPDMFIFGNTRPEKYLVLYNFYKWYSKKSGLSGFEADTQNLFKKYYKNSSKLTAKGLSLEQIVKLQEAIARDNEAIDFTLKYEKEHDVSKKLSDKISKDKGANI